MQAAAALHGRPGRRPDRHQRRPRPDRRRPDGARSWRASPAASWRSTRRSRSGSPGSCAPLMRAGRTSTRRRVRGGQPQAGDGARGRDGPRAGRAPRRAWWCRRRGPGPTVVVLPGPPRELQAMWPAAVETGAFQAAIARARRLRAARCCGCSASPSRRSPRRCACAESEIDGFDRARDHDLPAPRRGRGRDPLRARRRRRPATALAALIAERHADTLFSDRRPTIDEQVAELLAGRTAGASAESCTGGLLAARLTERPGSSAYFAGGVVVVLERGQDRPARRRPGADRAARRGLARGGRGDGRRRARALRGRRRRRRSPASPVRTAAPRRSRSGTSAGA